MKLRHLLLLLILLPAGIFIAQQRQNKSLTSQSDTALWEKIDSLINIAMPKQSQPYIDELKKRARKSKNTAESVKLLIYEMKINERRTEEALKVFIEQLEKETLTAWEPLQQITHSMLGEMYQEYYEQNRYALLEEYDENAETPKGWSHAEIIEKIIHHYRASIQNSNLLQSSNIGEFAPILTKGNQPETLRPTLYDFLAQRAIDAMQNSEYDIIRPMQEFVPEDADLWLPANTFVNLTLEPSTDTLNPQREALKLMQELLKFRLADTKNRTALFDAERNRINMLHSIYLGKDGDSLYWHAISQLLTLNPDNSTKALLLTDQASFLVDSDQDLFAGEGKQHPANEALKIVENCLKEHPKSAAACLAHNLKQRILHKELNILGEQEALPNRVVPVLISYKNLQKIHLNIYKLTKTEIEHFKNHNDSLPEKLAALKPICASEIKLPDFFDHQLHTLHYEAKPLESGLYLMAFSTKPTPGGKDNLMSFATLQVTELSALTLRENSTTFTIKVIHRQDGRPIENASVELTTSSDSWRDKDEKVQRSKSNHDGLASFVIPANHRSQKFTIQNNQDIYLAPSQWSYYQKQETNKDEKTIFFTDRKIYRPGQTVYFKAIHIRGEKNEWQTEADKSTVISLRDANGNEQGNITLMSNSYGAVWGSFTLPQGSLNGEWYLQNENGRTSFSVEEYKRPRFEVTFESFSEMVLPGEKATIEGRATAYAGNQISGAKVQYKINRYQRSFFPRQKNKEQVVAFGETITGEDGKFKFAFDATADKLLKQEWDQPIFQISVAITDLNGETREAETLYRVHESGITVEIDAENQYLSNDSIMLTYRTFNANSQPAQWSGKIKVVSMKRKTPWMPTTYWQKPDTTIADIVHFSFPGDTLWIEDQTILEQNITIAGSGSINLNSMCAPQPGEYQATLIGKDMAGKPISVTHHFTIIEGVKETAAYDAAEALLTVLTKKAVLGSPIRMAAASMLKGASAMMTYHFDDGTSSHETIELDGSQKIITLNIPSDKVEHGKISMTIIQNNRKFEASESFSIQHPQRILNPSLTSWRDKTEPGNVENWTMKVTREGNPAINTEIVATLYDASLDAYAANAWYFNTFGSQFAINNWTTTGFNIAYGAEINRINNHYKNCKTYNYHTLNWFGLSFGFHRGYMVRSMGAMNKSASAHEEVFMMTADQEISEEEAPIENLSSGHETAKTIRKDFSETAFFYPNLLTDDKGEVKISFTLPDNVTTYKFMALAHTSDGAWGKTEEQLTVQKELMVQPNLPMFMREEDEMTLTTKIVSLSKMDQKGLCSIAFTNAITGKPVQMVINKADHQFELKAGSTIAIDWKIKVPAGMEAINIAIEAKTDLHADGENHIIPILPRKVPVYESESFALFESGKNNIAIPGFTAHKGTKRMVFTYSTATATEILKALPLLMDYPHQCSEQIFSRYFGYAVGLHLSKEKSVESLLNGWQTEQLANKKPLQSPLLQNESLKSIALKETPWITEAEDESQMRERLLELLNPANVSNKMTQTIDKLAEQQLPDGSFPWFTGMQPSRYITQHIMTGFGWLKRMDTHRQENAKETQIIKKGMEYLQKELRHDLSEWQKDTSKTKLCGISTIHLLYALSFHQDKMNDEARPFIENIKKNRTKFQLFDQSMIALILHRNGETSIAQQIIQSIGENLVRQGNHLAYSKNNGYHWYNNSLETQALLIEAMNEVTPQNPDIEALRNWLITQKRTQSWPTTKSTAMAVYAVLSTPDIMKPANDEVKIGKSMQTTNISNPTISLVWSNQEVTAEVAKVRIDKEGNAPSFGAWHYFYFENSDIVKAHQSSELSIARQLSIVRSTEAGNRLLPVATETIKRGDKLRVRLTITAQNAMEYLHIRDQRAAGSEPAIQLSGYRYNRGLGYYQTMHDASADFFIDYLPKGTWIIEYDLTVVQTGRMNNGFASIESMYAPEMKAHTEGMVLNVEL